MEDGTGSARSVSTRDAAKRTQVARARRRRTATVRRAGTAPPAGPEPVAAQERHGGAQVFRARGNHLRRILGILDASAVVLAWGAVLVAPAALDGVQSADPVGLAVAVALVMATSIVVIAWQGLYRARVCGVRAVEIARLGRASLFAAALGYFAGNRLGVPMSLGRAAAAMACMFVLLSTFRGVYGTWLRRARTVGRYCRPVLLVGTGEEAQELHRLLTHHPELGYRVQGVLGNPDELAAWGGDTPWLGTVADTPAIVERTGATGVVLAASDIGSTQLNDLTRRLLDQGAHVHVSSGLRGLAHRRLRPLPLAHEPLFYVEPALLSPWQGFLKRSMDLAVAAVLLVVSSPLLALAAIAIKVQDGGPVLFRQRRVGRHGREFTLLKLRTMVPDAEERLVDLTFANQRNGPLFKLAQDPRRTRVGRWLERASLDEVPQLLNVLRGEMSLVGPRPALVHEAAQFDDRLRDRFLVLPGITGLWQVEGRENPEFDVYRRLDLFYVENWSPGLDLAILAATVQAVLARLFGPLLHRHTDPERASEAHAGQEVSGVVAEAEASA